MTGMGKFIFMDWLNLKLFFIVIAILSWAGYLWRLKVKNPEILHEWGFRMDNFREVLKMVLPFGIGAVLIFFIIGSIQNTLNLTWHIIPILVIYPVWGVIQQFLIIGLVEGNLLDQNAISIPKSVVVIFTAILFGLLHYPYWWLVLGTFILALFYGFIYIRSRNLYVLGLFHGWLGGIFFYTVVGRDPWVEIFSKYF